MTYREMMNENTENLSWCKPLSYLGGRVIIAVANGEIAGIRIDGEDKPVTAANIKAVSEMVAEGYADYQGWDDTHIILDSDSRELPCRECPWFGVCDAMDEEI